MKIDGKKRAMTLLEEVISVALLSIILIPISTMVTSSVLSNKKAEDKQKAAYIGQKILEEMASYDQINLENSAFMLLDGYKVRMEEENNYKSFISDNNLLTPEFEDYEIDNFTVNLSIKKNENFLLEEVQKSTSITDKIIDFRFQLNNTDIQYGADKKDFTGNNLTLIVSEVGEKIEFEIYDDTERLFKDIKDKQDSNILFYLDENFNKPQLLNISVKNLMTNTVNIFLEKNFLCTGNVDVKPETGILRVYNNITNQTITKTGDLYNISVEVKNKGGVLFKGSIAKNIIIK